MDRGFESELTALERFELERIEARLDAEDSDPQIEARDRQWEVPLRPGHGDVIIRSDERRRNAVE